MPWPVTSKRVDVCVLGGGWVGEGGGGGGAGLSFTKHAVTLWSMSWICFDYGPQAIGSLPRLWSCNLLCEGDMVLVFIVDRTEHFDLSYQDFKADCHRIRSPLPIPQMHDQTPICAPHPPASSVSSHTNLLWTTSCHCCTSPSMHQ